MAQAAKMTMMKRMMISTRPFRFRISQGMVSMLKSIAHEMIQVDVGKEDDDPVQDEDMRVVHWPALRSKMKK